MTLAAATITKHQLESYKHDLEYKILTINQAKLSLASSMEDLLTVGTDLDPDSPMLKQLEERKARLHLLEKKLDAQLEEYHIQIEMVEKNIQGCDKMIQSSLR